MRKFISNLENDTFSEIVVGLWLTIFCVIMLWFSALLS